MSKNFTASFIMVLSVMLVLSASLFAKGPEKDRGWQAPIGPEAMAEFDARVDAMLEAGFVMKTPVPHPSPSKSAAVLLLNADTLGHSTYDVYTNQIVEDQIALAPGGALDGTHQTYMFRFPLATSPRYGSYSMYSRLLASYVGQFDPTNHGGSGWPRVVNGPNAEGMYTYHYSSGTPAVVAAHLRIDDGEGFLSFTTDVTVDPVGLWPGNDRIGNTVVVTTTDDPLREPGRTYVSTDGGFTFGANIGYPAVVIPGATAFTNAETSPSLNPANPTQVGILNIEDAGGPAFGGYSWSVSSNLNPGATWNQSIIYEFNDVFPDNSFYNTWASGNNLSTHAAASYSADGTAHAVFNASGWQLGTAGDTLNSIHAVAYWNSAQQQVIEVSDPAVGRNPAIADSMNLYYPGAGLGMGFPNVSVGPNGLVLVAWEQPELEGPDELRYIFGMLGTTPVKFFATDIYASLSGDNGQTWTAPFKLAGEDNQMDVYPQISDIEQLSDGNHVHVIYFYDTNPGVSVTSNESDPSVCAWVYNEVLLPLPDGIEDPRGNVAENFQLHQNYPNPFNPGTTISYSLQKAADITLEVYNVTGQKVATLVKDHKTAGAHTVTLDATNFSSGIYFYRLSSGNVQLTKKMVLMK